MKNRKINSLSMQESIQQDKQINLDNSSQKKTYDKFNATIINERSQSYGIDSLLTEEIISVITGIPVQIIKTAVNEFGLAEFIKYSNSINLSESKRKKLELLYLFYSRLMNAPTKEKPILNSSSKAGDFAVNLFIGKTYECFFVICLDSQNRVNHAKLVHSGTINEAPVYPRLIVETALKYLANSVVLCHNHPGSSLQPSSADIEVTKRITTALEAISIKVVDHIIVAENKYTSFAEKGLIC